MRSTGVRYGLALAVALALRASTVVAAEAEAKALPTLLIKGEVVSLDTNDPSGTLLKVKDRYGFETPIFVTADTKVSQGEAASAVSSVTPGVAVEVEYNFDVNTAKRHAVSVKLAAAAPVPSAPAPAAAAPAPAVAPEAPVAAPAADAAQAAPSASESQSDAQPAAPAPAPAEVLAAPAQPEAAAPATQQ